MNGPQKLLNRQFVQIMCVGMLFGISMYMMNTLVPLLVDSLGASESVVGIVTSTLSIAALCTRPFGASMLDYFNKTKFLRVGLALLAVALCGYGLANSVAAVIAVRILHGAVFALMNALLMAMVSNAVPAEKLATGIGIYSLTTVVGGALGPSIGIWLNGAIGPSNTFYTMAGVLVLAMILSVGIEPGETDRSAGLRIRLDRLFVPGLLSPVMMATLTTIASASTISFIVLYGNAMNIEGAGLFFTVSAVATLLARIVGGEVYERFGADWAMIPGFLLLALSFILIGLAKSLPALLAAALVNALGGGVCTPIITAMSMQLVPRRMRGSAGNTQLIGTDVGFLAGAIIAGALVTGIETATGSEARGYSIMFMLMAIPTVGALILYMLTRRKLLKKIASVTREEAGEVRPTA